MAKAAIGHFLALAAMPIVRSMITLAHISDVHLAPLPLITPRELASKRLTGWLNWQLERGSDMRPETLMALLDHMRAHDPDMICVTGDMVNLALDEEIARAAHWFTELGAPGKVCAIPGNHDAYVPGALDKALDTYGGYMRGEALDDNPFPYVRRLDMVALIGVSSAIATPPFFAAGKVGADQLARLRKLLTLLGEAGYFRIVMIHHPPHAEFADSRRLGLWDGSDFRAVLKQAGAEVILHGHTHLSSVNAISGPTQEIPVIGVAAASAAPEGHDAPGRYNLFRIEKVGTEWSCAMREYGYQRIGDEIALRLQMRIY
ncbi:metallophosphoesterase family protein [Pelagibacterium halotolerans]|uniref:Putative phosphohydrolase, Icc family n=1 Tax=Pelagibacterium halotolerans (strain DSM 22347 / JCM 15775 / CGMCC 1.7692 / B2) TaxID=1082931 RepID=G4R6Q3_PELHB|nr:metallophosphoesterase [Pelagibacterium halotolerans]AEQ52215.1 putative phosphohydrolase, Icc family [Pelagibacterium halotolerans B2]